MKKARHTKNLQKKTGKKSTQKKKYPLRGKPVIYRNSFQGVATNDWDALK